jgi:hypothetical protein
MSLGDGRSKSDEELASIFRAMVTLRISDTSDDDPAIDELHDSSGAFTYDDLVKMSGLGVVMACNVLILFASSRGISPEEAWKIMCHYGRKHGFPGMI